MPTFESLQIKINDLKARIENESITPVYLGSILDDMLGLARRFPDQISGLSDAIDNLTKAVSEAKITAGVAETTAGFALNQAALAVDTASSAEANSNTAISTAQTALESAENAVSAVQASMKSFANTMILPFDGVIDELTEYHTNGIWYLRTGRKEGRFVVLENRWRYTDGDFNSTSNGGAKWPNPGRVWVDSKGRLYMSKGMGIVPMITAGDVEFDAEDGVLSINIDERWL